MHSQFMQRKSQPASAQWYPALFLHIHRRQDPPAVPDIDEERKMSN